MIRTIQDKQSSTMNSSINNRLLDENVINLKTYNTKTVTKPIMFLPSF